MLKLVKKPALANKAKASHIRPLQTMLHWVVASVVLHHLPLAAQEVDTSPAVRDSFSISSAYFENNYANNIDYSQFAMDVETASGRLALYGYNKYADVLNGPVSRVLYILGSTVLMDINGIFISYHEWGHASRAAAMGSRSKLYNCTDSSDCVAPRDFFGYAASQVFNSNISGAMAQLDDLTANSSSGRATDVIVTGAGVNNSTLTADRQVEKHFLRGKDNVFSLFFSSGNQAISGYGLGGDMSGVAESYRSTGVDASITASDLRNTNQISFFSGSVANLFMGIYDYGKTGNTQVKPWTVGGFLVPNQFNYLSSRGITRKWVSGYEWDESTKILGSYEYVVRGDSFAEPGLGVYKNFGGWDALVKVSGKTLEWANLETAFSKRIDKNWKLTATAYVWDSRSLLGERNSLKLSDNKTSQASIGVSYEY